jgi:hypothetical protein
VRQLVLHWHGDAVQVQHVGLVERQLRRAEHAAASAAGLVIVHHRVCVRVVVRVEVEDGGGLGWTAGKKEECALVWF